LVGGRGQANHPTRHHIPVLKVRYCPLCFSAKGAFHGVRGDSCFYSVSDLLPVRARWPILVWYPVPEFIDRTTARTPLAWRAGEPPPTLTYRVCQTYRDLPDSSSFNQFSNRSYSPTVHACPTRCRGERQRNPEWKNSGAEGGGEDKLPPPLVALRQERTIHASWPRGSSFARLRPASPGKRTAPTERFTLRRRFEIKAVPEVAISQTTGCRAPVPGNDDKGHGDVGDGCEEQSLREEMKLIHVWRPYPNHSSTKFVSTCMHSQPGSTARRARTSMLTNAILDTEKIAEGSIQSLIFI
jgi:hypothetical protein